MASLNKPLPIIADIPTLVHRQVPAESKNYGVLNEVKPSETPAENDINGSINRYKCSDGQLPTLLVLESCLCEINNARLSDRARRDLRNQRKALTTSHSELFSVSVGASFDSESNCSAAANQGLPSIRSEATTSDRYSTKLDSNESDLTSTTKQGMTETMQQDEFSSSLGITPRSKGTPTRTTVQRTMTDRDFLAKAVQARMRSKGYKQKSTRTELSSSSLTAANMPKSVQEKNKLSPVIENGNEEKNNTSPATQKSSSSNSPRGWNCGLCQKRNNYDRAKCQVCGRNRGLNASKTAKIGATITKHQLSSTSSKDVEKSSAVAETTKTEKFAVLQKAATKGNCIESIFLKHRLEYEKDALTALSEDIVSALSLVRSLNSTNTSNA
mmetsp:Transcript_13812/g.19788  ORF Transcript_13812/g.19788 Transcript_13812/m.19788 type:complete len:385 (+) Transcript_13812:1203-2357(+)